MDEVQEVTIQTAETTIKGNLSIPVGATGLILFAHGSSSGRFSPRNNFVAQELNNQQLATLLVDLLTPAEAAVDEISQEFRFNIDLLAARVYDATRYCATNIVINDLSIGYFGASTGAAAALKAAANSSIPIQAVVSRGGRPELAGEALGQVTSPTLLLVGSRDLKVMELNEQALGALTQVREKKLEIIPGATHLFEEPGTLEEVANQAAKWFWQYISRLNQ